jgi:hypothetical protein
MNGKIEHDFTFHLLKAIEYHNWFYNREIYQYELSEATKLDKEYIPVGSLEFVFDYIEKKYGVKNIKPINIPIELIGYEYLKRNVEIKNKDEIVLNCTKFLKSNTKYKSFTELVENLENVPDDEYLVSDTIDIESEWRGFVFNETLQDIRNYSGDFALFPDIEFVKKMIGDYKNAPGAYTIDIGINKKEQFLIEVHPFVSCGLYGFAEYKILPQMFIQGFRHLIKGITK